MHIALFHQHHHNPDCPATCRHYTFMTELVKRHKVTLVASNAWESIRITQQYDWVPPGVNLIEVKVPYQNKMGIYQRLQAFGSFAAHAILKGLKMPKPDLIWGVSTPLTTAWAAGQVAKYRKVPWIFEVQDLWPSFPIQMGAVPWKPIQEQLYRMEKSLYRQASHIITLSPDMERYVQGQGISASKITDLVNGTEVSNADVTSAQREAFKLQRGLTGKQIVLYAGTYGRANDIPMLVAAAKLLKHHPTIHFVFAGHGYHEPLLQQAAQEQSNILLLPPQPRHQVFNLFSIADVSLVSFINLPVLNSNSPGKFFDSLAAGVPVVVTNSGWTKELVTQNKCGWYVPAGKPEELANSLEQFLTQSEELRLSIKRNAVTVAKAQFDRLEMVPKLEHIFEKVVSLR